jgi:hypothetical protein
VNAFDEATITTPGLVLTPLRQDDADVMVDVLGDRQLHEFIGGQPAGHAELRERYGRLAAGSPHPDEIWLASSPPTTRSTANGSGASRLPPRS